MNHFVSELDRPKEFRAVCKGMNLVGLSVSPAIHCQSFCHCFWRPLLAKRSNAAFFATFALASFWVPFIFFLTFPMEQIKKTVVILALKNNNHNKKNSVRFAYACKKKCKPTHRGAWLRVFAVGKSPTVRGPWPISAFQPPNCQKSATWAIRTENQANRVSMVRFNISFGEFYFFPLHFFFFLVRLFICSEFDDSVLFCFFLFFWEVALKAASDC